jgi:hypothetical protein
VPQQRSQPLSPELRLVEQRPAPLRESVEVVSIEDDAGAAQLLEVVGRLVDRARAAGELRADVTVADVLLVIATAAPSLPDAAQQAAASARLLDILLEGLAVAAGVAPRGAGAGASGGVRVPPARVASAGCG